MQNKIKDILAMIYKNWWKTLFIILVLGLVLSGFAFSFGPLKCEKQKPEIPIWGAPNHG